MERTLVPYGVGRMVLPVPAEIMLGTYPSV
jgi:hypothetical protein